MPTLDVQTLVTDMMNATGLALDRKACCMFPAAMTAWSIRSLPQATRRLTSKAWASPPAWCSTRKATCSWATAAARFSRSAAQRQIYVFATLEPSLAAYHLAFGPDDYLYVTGPTTSSFDSVRRISRDGHVESVLPRSGPAAGHGLRRRRESVCGGFSRRTARRGADFAGRPARSCSSPARPSSAWRFLLRRR